MLQDPPGRGVIAMIPTTSIADLQHRNAGRKPRSGIEPDTALPLRGCRPFVEPGSLALSIHTRATSRTTNRHEHQLWSGNCCSQATLKVPYHFVIIHHVPVLALQPAGRQTQARDESALTHTLKLSRRERELRVFFCQEP